MAIIYLGLGANMGTPSFTFQKVIKLLNNIKVIKQSPLYYNEPLAKKKIPWFTNQVLECETDLSVIELLSTTQKIEQTLGRQKRSHWMEREIDIDILFYDQKIIDTPDLQIPHHGIPDRLFVLQPLCDINPELKHPVLNKNIFQLLKNCQNKSVLELKKIS